jgi:hypothetical protein
MRSAEFSGGVDYRKEPEIRKTVESCYLYPQCSTWLEIHDVLEARVIADGLPQLPKMVSEGTQVMIERKR